MARFYEQHGRRPSRAAGLAVAVAMAAGTAVMLTAPAAHAEVIDVNYQCRTPIGNKGAVSPIDIKSTPSGGAYKLVMSFQKGSPPAPSSWARGP